MRDLYSNDVRTAAYLAGDGGTVEPDYDRNEDRPPQTNCPFCELPLIAEGDRAGECPDHGWPSPDGP